ncbi:MAG: FecR domain-containing protein [Polyangiaceae bacterium]
MRVIVSRRLRCAASLWVLLLAASAQAAPKPTPGYPERVLHWSIQKGETCALIAKALYGSAKHAALLTRYNNVDCGRPLTEGLTLVVPEMVGTVPTAQLSSMAPEVKARPPGAGWQPAQPGMSLYESHSVNTLDAARANIVFADRTRVYLAENTLVVIYDTASHTRVSKTPPARVELQSGEVQAGLAALRGKPVEISVQGDARVSAQSKEAAVRKKGKRSTVSVFDGKASVRSGGKAVEVPEKHGSAFVEREAPTPPRPLPPAPRYGADSSQGIVVTTREESRVFVSWSEVPRAVAYRVELSRNDEFSDLVVREEVPANIHAFRAEKLPPGAYYVRVRAIDDEDFLGLASERRDVTLVQGALVGGTIRTGKIVANPYGRLTLSPDPNLELSLDGQTFSPMPTELDLLSLAPKQLVLRARGSSDATRLAVEYESPRAQIQWQDVGTRAVSVRLIGLEGIDIDGRVAPKLWLSRPGGNREAVALSPTGMAGSYRATLPEFGPDDPTLDLVDSRGRLLGSETLPLDRVRSERPDEPLRPLGLIAPPVVPSPALSVSWWAPSAVNSGALGVTGSRESSENRLQGHARAQGTAGAFGADALLLSDAAGSAPGPDRAAWLGLRWRAVRAEDHTEVAPAVRVGIPTTRGGSPTRAELGVAIGMRREKLGLLANLGGRAALDEDGGSNTPEAQGFLLTGATWEFNDWLLGYGVADAHGLVNHDEVAPRAGLSLGLEVGTRLVGSLGLRASPWDEDGGHVLGQLAIGVREPLR